MAEGANCLFRNQPSVTVSLHTIPAEDEEAEAAERLEEAGVLVQANPLDVDFFLSGLGDLGVDLTTVAATEAVPEFANDTSRFTGSGTQGKWRAVLALAREDRLDPKWADIGVGETDL